MKPSSLARLIVLLLAVSSLPAHAESAADKPAADQSVSSDQGSTPKTRRKRARNTPDSGTLADNEKSPSAQKQVRISRGSKTLSGEPAAREGWKHLAAGDAGQARNDFESVLKADPRNADALRGLAHLAASQNHPALARQYLTRALEANPRDSHAAAAMIALSASADPQAAESQIKTLIARDPDEALAHFALGNVLAQGARWVEAQDAFFRAWTLDTENPDYQYNLAVSLDRLRQPALALSHYRGAIDALARRKAAFDLERTRERVAELEATGEPAQPKQP